ncbi:hypothetical protein E4T44_00610 [Aureobasidium sp. EXF-8845]|nr:hypothetical protein E4T44_00610 [Aureobasidium sp. EXF-8845]KAI4857922.1 hypothetical protein E4T45_00570 [Aureobasidium sp. EXF-8846]
MVQHAPIGMCMDRGDGYPIYVNDVYLDLIGTDRTSFFDSAKAGFAWRSFDFQRNADAIEESWSAAVKSGKTASFEISVGCDTAPRWLEVFVQQRYNENDVLVFIFSWLTDISARKAVESVVEERLAEAIENRRASENFIDMGDMSAIVAHDSILQLADSISLTLPPVVTGKSTSFSLTNESLGILTEEARNVLLDTAQTITICAKHQKNIIDEVLTFSKLDSKLIVLAPEAVQPLRVISDVLRMNKSELRQADIEGNLDIQSSYKDLDIDYVSLDPGRVSQVIINFMNNAIKFTRASSVRKITLSLAASQTRPTAESCNITLIEPRQKARYLPTPGTGTEVFLTFTVQDTGCGLTQAETKNLFQRFSQASPKTYKQYGGSGLGLFISRELVELHGGQVEVHSCAKVHAANHGLEALDFLSTTTFCGGDVPLSIILLDVEMPIMDGLTCARRIRESEQLNKTKHVPICGITANARTSQIDSCIEAGMDEVVTKPFRMPQLIPRMLALVDKHSSP